MGMELGRIDPNCKLNFKSLEGFYITLVLL